MEVKRLAGDITERSVYITYGFDRVGILTERMNDACEVEYVFKFFWDVLDKLDIFEDFPGINLSLRRDEYVRDHLPSFIRERIPPKNRRDASEYMKKFGIKSYDPFDLLIALHRPGIDSYNDNWRVEEMESEGNEADKR